MITSAISAGLILKDKATRHPQKHKTAERSEQKARGIDSAYPFSHGGEEDSAVHRIKARTVPLAIDRTTRVGPDLLEPAIPF